VFLIGCSYHREIHKINVIFKCSKLPDMMSPQAVAYFCRSLSIGRLSSNMMKWTFLWDLLSH
jgi:hypothetical protein